MGVKKLVLLGSILAGLAIIGLIRYLQWYSKNVIIADVVSNESMESTLDNETSGRLLRVIKDARMELGTPSLQAAVIIKGKGKWTGSVGWANPEAKKVATVDDLYHIGSVSKMYTSAVIMMLVEEGKLSLEDPISKYIPGYPQGGKITIRNLLNHTSGISNYTEGLGWQLKTVLLRKKWTEDENLKYAHTQNSKFEPGTHHYYSNTNYVLLGEIAQRVSGKPFSTLLREHFLTPQGLNQTYFLTYLCIYLSTTT